MLNVVSKNINTKKADKIIFMLL